MHERGAIFARTLQRSSRAMPFSNRDVIHDPFDRKRSGNAFPAGWFTQGGSGGQRREVHVGERSDAFTGRRVRFWQDDHWTVFAWPYRADCRADHFRRNEYWFENLRSIAFDA